VLFGVTFLQAIDKGVEFFSLAKAKVPVLKWKVMQNDSFILTLIASLALEVLFGVTTFQFFYIRQKSVPVFKKYSCRIIPATLKGMSL